MKKDLPDECDASMPQKYILTGLKPQWINSLVHFRGCEKVLEAFFEYTNRNRIV